MLETLLFGGPADRVGPVALRPRLAPGLPLSTSGCSASATLSFCPRSEGLRAKGPAEIFNFPGSCSSFLPARVASRRILPLGRRSRCRLVC
jgi:hypothetical protein